MTLLYPLNHLHPPKTKCTPPEQAVHPPKRFSIKTRYLFQKQQAALWAVCCFWKKEMERFESESNAPVGRSSIGANTGRFHSLRRPPQDAGSRISPSPPEKSTRKRAFFNDINPLRGFVICASRVIFAFGE